MNREIKFRAFDFEEKKLWYSEAQRSEWAEALKRWIAHPERYQVMQFTGLKDKSGKEIYEGDLVIRPNATEPMNEEIWQVVWNQTQLFGFALQQGVYYCGLIEPDDTFEIIGNVYEHPELLK